jgi:hypothetical protein
MIGQFSYSEMPCTKHVAVRLGWQSGESVARVETPADVAQVLPFHIPLDDEYMSLPIALGYAVMISGMSGTKMTLTGDVSAWPEQWGALSTRYS